MHIVMFFLYKIHYFLTYRRNLLETTQYMDTENGFYMIYHRSHSKLI